ncbi:hypothetical protein TNIN_337521 [Trichonephila inaurata madagascariensis]|uniref:Uncharacterized protein n=1 Tax=Trichonephila inaurata madagascariensis TaxID=2747483 RepID=A0A8X6XM69_9ARAC|nr:hypothetical protein TNIN_337521 [Trichonephila inaurata madagascariensis]
MVSALTIRQVAELSRMTSCNNDGCLLLRACKVRIGLKRIGRRFVHHGLIQLKKRGTFERLELIKLDFLAVCVVLVLWLGIG